jgi:hypothetical protein
MWGRMLLGAVLLGGCTSMGRVAELDFVATRELPARTSIVKRNVRGEDCTTFAFSGIPSIEDALEDAQKGVVDGEGLANVGIYVEQSYYVFATRVCYIVTGDVVKLKDRKAEDAPAAAPE